MSPARYIASKYENAVDLGLDLDAMRRYLLDRGIKRTPADVVFDLDERYGFYEYASRHVSPAKPDERAMDALIERTPSAAINKARNVAQRLVAII